MKAGLTADVYRNSAHSVDCTLGGLSSRYSEGVLIGEGVAPVFEPTETMPAFVLQERRGHLFCVPADPETGQALPGWWMFGGNFLFCCDSRFREVTGGALPIHDRQEKQR